IKANGNIQEVVEKNIEKGTHALKALVAQADGIQQTADENGMARHFSNVLFNIMRGGIYGDNYLIDGSLFRKHVQHFNKRCWEKHSDLFSSLSETIEYSELGKLIEQQNDANLIRLFQEYLPLTFSRRHGDPSRPWNMFNINIKDEAGNKVLSYQVVSRKLARYFSKLGGPFDIVPKLHQWHYCQVFECDYRRWLQSLSNYERRH
ncbi:MAG: hypothetical protein NTY32_03490, partial [Bacteroidia bacterium]|nr:hypothetical protein [Bacteroidia bacterium]